MSKLTTLYKQPSESRLYDVDFGANLASTETISSVTSYTATPSGLTLDPAIAIDGSKVQRRISGGTAGTQYKLTVVILTSLGNILEGEGLLVVLDN